MSEVPADIKDLATLREEYIRLFEKLHERLGGPIVLLSMVVELTALVDLHLKAGLFTELEYTQAVIDAANRIAKFGDKENQINGHDV